MKRFYANRTNEDKVVKFTRSHGDTEMTENKIGDIIVERAVNLHRELGSGLLEIVYQDGISRIINGQL